MNSDFTEKEYSFLRRAFIEKGELIPTTEIIVGGAQAGKTLRLYEDLASRGKLPESLKDFEAFKKRMRERRER